MIETEDGTDEAHRRAEAIREVASAASDLPLDRVVDTVAMLLVDAIIDEEIPPLRAFLDEASRLAQDDRVDQRSLDALAAVAGWGVTRTLPAAIGRSIDLATAAGRILLFVAEAPDCSSKDIFMALSIAEETVSRVGAQLEGDGLIIRTRAGKWRRWRLTRAGENALQAALLHDQDDESATRRREGIPEVMKQFEDERGDTGVSPPSSPSTGQGVGREFLRRMQHRKRAKNTGKADQESNDEQPTQPD